MPLTLSEIFMQYICPSLGTIMASAMFAAPIQSLRKALSRGRLGDLNPTPWAFMTGNCLGWVAYSFVTQNIFVLVSNLPGLILSVWLNMGAAKLQYVQRYDAETSLVRNDYSLRFEETNTSTPNNEEEFDVNSSNNNNNSNIINSNDDDDNAPRSDYGNLDMPASTSHEHWVIGVLMVWGLTLSSVIFIPMTNLYRADIIGIVVNLNLVVFYGAPLSTIIKVFKTRSSASIHRKTLAMAVLNSFFWLVYGLALMDMVIFLPNFCGFVLSMVQILLCLVFPRAKHGDQMSEQFVDSNSEPTVDGFINHEDEGERNDTNLEML